ncbi:putative armadillo-like helical protein [Helianthus debilis subsp. tardiflorus]
MEMSLLKALLKNISAFLHLPDNKCSEIVEKYYIKNEHVLKLIKPVLESIVDADVASDQALQKEFAGMSQSVDEVRELFDESHPLMSKVYFVLKAESLVTKVQTHCLDILELLQSCEGLPVELSSASLEHCVQKIKHMGYEKPSAIISKAIKEQVEGNEPSSDIRSEIADLLSLKSNQELLIELVALENLKEDAEQLEKIRDALIASWCESNNVNLPDPVKSMIRQEEASLVNHVHSSSEDSMPELENESVELNESGERIVDSGGPAAISLPRNESPGGGGVDDGSVEHSHGSNEESSPQVVTGNSSDASGEVMAEAHPAVAATSAAPQTDPHEYSPRFRTRPRNPIWRRPSERFGPRIISSVPETRSDLGEIETQVKKLIDDLSSTSLDTVKNATLELRLLARHDKDIRNVIANCGAINLLIGLLYSPDQNIQENAVTALLNLSINDINKTTIGNSNAIEPLIHVLETGSSEAKENSAATLFSLSVIEENKIKIGRSGAIGPLVDLLGNGTPRGKKDAATALFNLSTFHENKGRIVQAGAVRFLVDLMDPAAGLVDKAVAVLSNLATIPEGRARIGQEGGIPMLVEVVELGSARAKENAAAALLQLCTNSNRFCNMVLHEGAIPPLAALSHTGTPRAKEKAQSLLSFFRNQRHGNGGRR